MLWFVNTLYMYFVLICFEMLQVIDKQPYSQLLIIIFFLNF